tara:strand:+ start:2159 stop:2905 length:747 start_codon:yes stop_codon:yes gene_type:complete
MEEKKHKFPTETIDLPSKGLIYPEDNALSKGKIEMKYMTAKEEDILTNQSYIEAGTVLDKLLQSLIVSDINYNDLITGDKNALLIAARVLGYGKDYKFEYKGEEVEVDLSEIDNKEFDEDSITKGENKFPFTLPNSKTEIEYKILTANDEKKIAAEVRGLKKVNKKENRELSTRLKYMIISVDKEEEKKTIREFVDTYLLAMDSRALRKHIAETQPDVDLNVIIDTSSGPEDITIPINLNFFWPDADV